MDTKIEHQQQVAKSHYAFNTYVGLPRWCSYYYQLKEILGIQNIHSIVEVGAGVPILKVNVKFFRPEVDYHVVDIADDLNPDLLGSVTQIPLPDESADLVMAFQVLEHIPYSDFKRALQEMSRVSKKHVLLSLPHSGSPFLLNLKIPLLPWFRIFMKLPSPKSHQFDGQHYWEVGKRDYSVKKVRDDISTQFRIIKEYTFFENHYHRLYVLEKK